MFWEWVWETELEHREPELEHNPFYNFPKFPSWYSEFTTTLLLMHLLSWEQEDISFFWTEMVTMSSPVDSPAPARITPSQAVPLSFLLTGHKPSVSFFLLLYFLSFLFGLFLSGTSSHPPQPFSAFSLGASCLPDEGLIHAGNTKQFDLPVAFYLSGVSAMCSEKHKEEHLCPSMLQERWWWWAEQGKRQEGLALKDGGQTQATNP